MGIHWVFALIIWWVVVQVDVGFWGGPGGRFWKCNGDIRKIIISHGAVIDSLIIVYMKDGVTKQSIRFGGKGGDYKDVKNICYLHVC